MMNLVLKVMALLAFLGGLFGMLAGILFALTANILGLALGTILFIMGGLLLQAGQELIDEYLEPEVLTEEEP